MVAMIDKIPAILEELESAVSGSLDSLGGTIVKYAKGYVPVDTGRLRDSISYSITEGTLRIGTPVPYAVFVELGVSGRPGAHFLRQAVAMPGDLYASILSAALEMRLKGGENHVILEEKAEDGEG